MGTMDTEQHDRATAVLRSPSPKNRASGELQMMPRLGLCGRTGAGAVQTASGGGAARTQEECVAVRCARSETLWWPRAALERGLHTVPTGRVWPLTVSSE